MFDSVFIYFYLNIDIYNIKLLYIYSACFVRATSEKNKSLHLLKNTFYMKVNPLFRFLQDFLNDPRCHNHPNPTQLPFFPYQIVLLNYIKHIICLLSIHFTSYVFLIETSAAMYIWYCIYSYGEWLYKPRLSSLCNFACIYICLYCPLIFVFVCR